MPYKQVEHTADVALQITGNTIEELFSEAAKGFYSLVLKKGELGIKEKWHIEVDALDLESLLVEWLNELVFLFETQTALAKEVRIISLDDKSLKADLIGESYDESKHELEHQIKAATYHDLKIRKNKKWKATVIFDV